MRDFTWHHNTTTLLPHYVVAWTTFTRIACNVHISWNYVHVWKYMYHGSTRMENNMRVYLHVLTSIKLMEYIVLHYNCKQYTYIAIKFGKLW